MTTSKSKSRVSVRTFYEVGKRDLSLELVSGASSLRRAITETAINRPGLALTGYCEHFPPRRVQVIGLAEHGYLKSLDSKARETALRRFYELKVPCVVLSRNLRPFAGMEKLADRYRTPLLRTPMITKHFVNAATIIMENLTAPRMKVQGTMMEIQGIGVLIEGRPGIGKSESALALIRQGAALVSDDVTALRRDSAGAVMASAVDVTRFHMEIRGVGIIHVPSLYGVASVRGEKKLEMVVTLCDPKECEMGGVNLYEHGTRDILGTPIPHVMIPVAPGRAVSHIVEAAALDQKLRVLGHDAEKELDENLMALLSEGRNGSE